MKTRTPFADKKNVGKLTDVLDHLVHNHLFSNHLAKFFCLNKIIEIIIPQILSKLVGSALAYIFKVVC